MHQCDEESVWIEVAIYRKLMAPAGIWSKIAELG